MDPVEIIRDGERTYAYLIRAGWTPAATTFLTPDHLGQQIGMIVCAAGQEITPHLHRPIVRQVEGTSECIVVRQGACTLDIYDADRALVTSRALAVGDIVLLLDGGHGFRMQRDTVLFEVKQGPYAGARDKERFERPGRLPESAGPGGSAP